MGAGGFRGPFFVFFLANFMFFSGSKGQFSLFLVFFWAKFPASFPFFGVFWGKISCFFFFAGSKGLSVFVIFVAKEKDLVKGGCLQVLNGFILVLKLR